MALVEPTTWPCPANGSTHWGLWKRDQNGLSISRPLYSNEDGTLIRHQSLNEYKVNLMEEHIKMLELALEKHGVHHYDCAVHDDGGYNFGICDCGYSETLNALDLIPKLPQG